jgi:hypothetical protein
MSINGHMKVTAGAMQVMQYEAGPYNVIFNQIPGRQSGQTPWLKLASECAVT